MVILKRILLFSIFCFGMGQIGKAQVITPPALQCVENNNGNGNITLSWTDPAVNPCGPFVSYTIYGSSHGPGGPYDSVIVVSAQAATSATLTNYLSISQTWYFYMVANYNCPGFTSLSSDTVNNLPPDVPQIVNVTVTPGGKAVLNWAPVSSPQTSFYILYKYLPNGQAIPLDTIFGRLNTTGTDTLAVDDPTQRSYSYSVAAFDSCGNHSGFNTLPHNTILSNATVTACHQEMNISWNRYINWPKGVLVYRIYLSANAGPFNLIASTDSGTFTYIYTSFNDGDSILLYVQALSAADTNIVSNSNIFVLKAAIVQPPSYMYITNITVTPANNIDVTWTIDTIAQLLLYKIERSSDSVNYVDHAVFAVPTPLQHFQTFTDSVGLSLGSNPYYYEIAAFDSCQNQYKSPYGESVNLNGELYDYFVAQLTWNDFVLKYATVINYTLYRDFGNGFQQIKTFAPGTNLYYDSLQQFIADKGTFCYKIEATYTISLPPPSNYTATLTSFSNTVCVVHRPIIYIPNAFSPGGLNSVFKPTIIYGDPHNYSMTIFNRWGAEIFKTTDHNAGWDGTDKGQPATMGGYAYLIQFTADDGVVVQKDGIVLLVR